MTEGFVHSEDIGAIGAKIVEMADVVREAELQRAGAQARWAFEMDGIRYRVLIAVEGLSPEPAGVQ